MMMATMTTAMGMVMLIVICWIHSMHVDSKSCPECRCHRNVLHDRLELKLPWWCLTWRWRNMTELCAGCSWAKCTKKQRLHRVMFGNFFSISWCAFFIIWFFILKQLVISIISFLQLKLSRSPRAAVSATRCLDFAFFSLSSPVHHSPFGGHVAATTNQLTCWRIRLPRRGGWGVAGDTCSIMGKSTLEETLEETLVYFLGFLGFLGLDGLSSVADFQF